MIMCFIVNAWCHMMLFWILKLIIVATIRRVLKRYGGSACQRWQALNKIAIATIRLFNHAAHAGSDTFLCCLTKLTLFMSTLIHFFRKIINIVFATLGLVLLSAGQLIFNLELQLGNSNTCALFRPSFALIDFLVNLFNDILILSRKMRVHLFPTSLKALYAVASS